MSGIKEELAKRASSLGKDSPGNGEDENKAPSLRENETEEQLGLEEGAIGMDCGKAFVRLLRADEIECRVSTINERGLSLLLFKDARVDQRILDETFTPFGWKRSHQIIDGNLYCTVEIWDEAKCQWIAKQDVGTTSYSEKEKGQASDSFKRACFNWGIGRELYTAPFIWLSAEKVTIQKKDNKLVTSDRFSVQSISYNEQREIDSLVIVNGKRVKVYELKSSQNVGSRQKTAQGTDNRQNTAGQQKKGWNPENLQNDGGQQKTGTDTGGWQDAGRETGNREKMNQEAEQKPGEIWITSVQIVALEQELKRTGVSIKDVLARYRIQKLEQMTPEIYTKAINGLKKTKSREAA